MNNVQILNNAQKQPLNMSDIVQRFIALGYELSYRDGDRYIKLVKLFNNSHIKVEGGDEVQVGRYIVLCDGNVKSVPLMKRGYLWSGSAYTQQHKNNIYALGDERLVARF